MQESQKSPFSHHSWKIISSISKKSNKENFCLIPLSTNELPKRIAIRIIWVYRLLFLYTMCITHIIWIIETHRFLPLVWNQSLNFWRISPPVCWKHRMKTNVNEICRNVDWIIWKINTIYFKRYIHGRYTAMNHCKRYNIKNEPLFIVVASYTTMTTMQITTITIIFDRIKIRTNIFFSLSLPFSSI